MGKARPVRFISNVKERDPNYGKSVPRLNTQNSVKNAQEIFRHYVPPGRKLSEELIQERREEALRDK